MAQTSVCALEILCGMKAELIALVRNHPYLTSEKYLVYKVYYLTCLILLSTINRSTWFGVPSFVIFRRPVAL